MDANSPLVETVPKNIARFMLAFACTFVINFFLFPLVLILIVLVGGFFLKGIGLGSLAELVSTLPVILTIAYLGSAVIAGEVIVQGFVASILCFGLVLLLLWMTTFQRRQAAAFVASVGLGNFLGLVLAGERMSSSSNLGFNKEMAMLCFPVLTAMVVAFFVARLIWVEERMA